MLITRPKGKSTLKGEVKINDKLYNKWEYVCGSERHIFLEPLINWVKQPDEKILNVFLPHKKKQTDTELQAFINQNKKQPTN